MPSFDLPRIVLCTVPIPSLILLVLIGLYHLMPLLTLLPNVHLSPLLEFLSTLIPMPKRNLPRAFFNLPPRPGSPSARAALEGLTVLSIRGKVLLVLVGHSIVGLSCGWAFLAGGKGWSLVGVASTGTLSAIAWLSVFSVFRPRPGKLDRLMRGGGVTHSTVFTRVFPLSLIAPIVMACVAAAGSPTAQVAILAVSSALVAVCVSCSLVGGYRLYVKPKKGALRLASPGAGEQDLSGAIEESWLTEPSQPRQDSHVSAFSFSPTPSFKTPKPRTNRRSSLFDGTPTSWLTSPTVTPHTLPSWERTPDIASPPVAQTRHRLSSPIPPESLPRPIQPAPARRNKTSAATTAGDRTMLTATSLASPGGSILGGYEPDPSQPVPPRGFASLTSFPLSPEEVEVVGGSRVSLAMRYGRTGDGFAFIPEERENQDAHDPRASSWTLETYYSGSEVQAMPSRNGSTTPATARRAPPPPPMPVDIPLPPTPTAARSETAVAWGPHAKESREWLIGERDWVEVDGDADAMDDWSREGRGVGIVTIVGVLICHALSVPMLVVGQPSNMDEVLYLLSIMFPAPMIAFASYLLRYRPTSTTRERIKKTSLKSVSTHRSLALQSASELSLPHSLSPKLTPVNEKRVLQPNARFSHFLELKPSVSNFGFNRRLRPHTVYGVKDARDQLRMRDGYQEARFRKNMNRRSTDVWLEEGLAVGTVTRWSRTAEMLKPNPALCVLDAPRPAEGVLRKLRGGVVSMLPKRFSAVLEDYQLDTFPTPTGDNNVTPSSPIAISVTSSNEHYNRSASALSVVMTNEGEVDGDCDETERGRTTQPAEIRIATKGRRSVSSVVYSPRPDSVPGVADQGGYDLDWMTAGVLPNLIPNLKIGSQMRVAPGTDALLRRRASQPIMGSHISDDDRLGEVPGLRSSLDMSTPVRRGHRRAHSSSFDFSTSPDFMGATTSTPHATGVRHHARRLKASFSLPVIYPVDFADIRRSFDACGVSPQKETAQAGDQQDMGIDLPPIPASIYAFSRRHLNRLTERDEANESSLMRETISDMRGAILALSSPAPSRTAPQADVSTASSRMDLADLAPIILHGEVLNASISSSIRSEEAEEMERVMEMDSPTRAEYVISPPGSSYASSLGGRDSRASLRTTRSTSTDQARIPPVPGRYSATGRTTPSASSGDDPDLYVTPGRYSDADESFHPPPPRAREISLDIPELREYRALQHSTSMPSMSAHPHPAPSSAYRTIQPATSIPNFSRPGAAATGGGELGIGITSHPPIPIKEQQALRSRKSNETMASDFTHATGTTPSTSPARPAEEFRPSRQELARVEMLKERQTAMATMAATAPGALETRAAKAAQNGKAGSRGTVRLVERRIDENAISMPMPFLPRPKNEALVYSDAGAHGGTSEISGGGKGSKRVLAGRRGPVKSSKMSTTSMGSGKENEIGKGAIRTGKSSKLSTVSTGSGKENEIGRVAKSSMASAGSGARVLRA